MIRFLAAFSHAAPTALGYDPTIERIVVDADSVKLDPAKIDTKTKPKIQYIIKVGKKKKYQTTRCLFDYKADALRGRGTRVWEVFPVDEPTTRLVLKDVWLDGKSEGSLWAELKTAVQHNPEDQELFNAHFLTHLYGAEVPAIGGKLEKSDIVDLLTIGLPTVQPQRESITHTGSGRVFSVGQPAVVPRPVKSIKDKLAALVVSPRKHYRELFEQVCIVYHNLTEVPTMFTALCHTVKGTFDFARVNVPYV